MMTRLKEFAFSGISYQPSKDNFQKPMNGYCRNFGMFAKSSIG